MARVTSDDDKYNDDFDDANDDLGGVHADDNRDQLRRSIDGNELLADEAATIAEERFSEPAPAGSELEDENTVEAEGFERGVGDDEDPDDVANYGFHVEE